MESNKEESIRCLDLGYKARDEGNLTRAAKLANKSNKLYPTQRAKDLLEELSKHERASSHISTDASIPDSSPSAHPNNNVSIDPDTLSEINRILSCKNLYDILNLPHDASQTEIKKQYRKLALKFHPDKCTAPRATEAFKTIGRSFGILSDSDKRRKYDVMGDDADTVNHHGEHPFFGEEMDPFDLFANIFMNADLGGGFLSNGRAYRGYRVHNRAGGPRVYTYTTSNQRNQVQPLNFTNILPILPLLFLLLWSIFNSFIFTDSAPYSFQSSRHYSVLRRLGEGTNYVYYVHRDFEREFSTQEAIKRVEYSVITDYLDYFGQKCQREMYVKQQRIRSAQFYQNQEAVIQAQNIVTQSCTNVNELQELRSRG